MLYQPTTYGIALLLMLISMVCWGSWPVTMKFTPGWRFQLYYWDFVIGVVFTSLVLGLTLGGIHGPTSFVSNLRHADALHIFWAMLAGVVFDVANLLLVAAIEYAGLSVAFPLGAGLALVEGVLLDYLLAPRGNPILLFGGVFLVMMAIVFDARAYRIRERTQHKAATSKGIVISLVAGILLGLFYPLAIKSFSGENALGPLSLVFISSLGALLCNIPMNYYLMRRPISGGTPIPMKSYFEGRGSYHLLGLLGGLVWCSGTVLSLVAANAHIVGPAVSYAIGQGCTMVSAIWGVFVWQEFAGAPGEARVQLALMFLLFVAGLAAVALAPII